MVCLNNSSALPTYRPQKKHDVSAMSCWQAPPEEGFNCATCRALRSFDDIYTGELAQCPCLLCIPCVREQASSVLEQRLSHLLEPVKQRGRQGAAPLAGSLECPVLHCSLQLAHAALLNRHWYPSIISSLACYFPRQLACAALPTLMGHQARCIFCTHQGPVMGPEPAGKQQTSLSMAAQQTSSRNEFRA